MSRLPFWKLSGAGNDFVLLEGRRRDGAALARRLCDRREGVGADGLLMLERGRRPRLLYWNADGSRAFCGNGVRCAAWWLSCRATARQLELDTAAGPLRARIVGRERAAVTMPAPRKVRLGLRLRTIGKTLTIHSIDTGVPHAVVLVGDVETAAVERLGPVIRRHRAFGAAGANVDFVALATRGLALRTYERGVEGETLACGTGAVAAAAVADLLGLRRPPIDVQARGGRLTVRFSREGDAFSNVWLEGPARIAFSGEISV